MIISLKLKLNANYNRTGFNLVVNLGSVFGDKKYNHGSKISNKIADSLINQMRSSLCFLGCLAPLSISSKAFDTHRGLLLGILFRRNFSFRGMFI